MISPDPNANNEVWCVVAEKNPNFDCCDCEKLRRPGKGKRDTLFCCQDRLMFSLSLCSQPIIAYCLLLFVASLVCFCLYLNVTLITVLLFCLLLLTSRGVTGVCISFIFFFSFFVSHKNTTKKKGKSRNNKIEQQQEQRKTKRRQHSPSLSSPYQSNSNKRNRATS